MTSGGLPHFQGYTSRTVTYKKVDGLDIKLDVLFPSSKRPGPVPVLIHYHGGFLVVGDRYAFLPVWLISAAVNRGWIFVTPDYRLMPETTAHSSLDDAIDAYTWVLKSLGEQTGLEIGPVAIAGSSAGGWLALATAAAVTVKPKAIVSIYGTLDFSNKRYISEGDALFGAPAPDTSATLQQLEQIQRSPGQNVTTGSALPENPLEEPRFAFVLALHVNRLYPDYLTGVKGLREAIETRGLEAIPPEHRRLFPTALGGNLSGLPPVLLMHGKNDGAVPFSLSEQTAERLSAAGVDTETIFLDDAQHGFDGRSGVKDLDKEGDKDEFKTPAIQSLKDIVRYLEKHLG